MNLKQALKITLLIVILAEEIKSVVENFKNCKNSKNVQIVILEQLNRLNSVRTVDINLAK
ncbi:hypothetical protein [Staphylococcus xylosus]|uniref:hypothetical protein n=1 Tax=Staphylococcus xylosus TaxID=1288 RepID=UPI0020CD37CC|nr:hypothetical protein [Staphylococcus xylosus]